MALGKKTKAYQDILENAIGLTTGVVIAVDPSIGSGARGSSPGFAIYRESQYFDSGVIELPSNDSIPWRLQSLGNALTFLYEQYQPDVLVYEDIPAQSHGKGAVGHASLLKAVGAILAIPGPDAFVGIMPISWKKLARPTYVKSDENDAIEIGWICIEEAKKIIKEKS